MGGFDDLIERLLYDVSLAGSKGYVGAQLETAVKAFYHEKDSQANQISNGDGNLLFSDAPPAKQTTVDKQLIETVFTWLCKHPDIKVRDAREAPSESIDQNVSRSELGPQLAGKIIFTTNDRIWHAITGHGVDHKRVPQSEFDILSVIASHGPEGILQPLVRKATGQDKRSVPKRTDSLAEKGYITKEAVVAAAQSTSLLKLTKYSQERALNKNTPSKPQADRHGSVKHIVYYEEWFNTTIRLLRENNDAMTTSALRVGLGIKPKSRWEHKLLLSCLRRLSTTGCIHRVMGKVAASSEPRVQAIQLLREPTEIDRLAWRKHERNPARVSDNVDDIDEVAATTRRTDLDDDTSDADAADSDTEEDIVEVDEDEEIDDLDLIKDRVPPQWRPEIPLPNQIFDILNNARQNGVNSTELAMRVTGPHWRRPLDEVMYHLTDVWEYSQPLHLRHLAVVRDSAGHGPSSQFQYRTLENLEKAIEDGSATWGSVKSGLGPKAKKNPLAGEPDLDEFGFPNPVLKDLVSRDGRATLADGRQGIQVEAVVDDDGHDLEAEVRAEAEVEAETPTLPAEKRPKPIRKRRAVGRKSTLDAEGVDPGDQSPVAPVRIGGRSRTKSHPSGNRVMFRSHQNPATANDTSGTVQGSKSSNRRHSFLSAERIEPDDEGSSIVLDVPASHNAVPTADVQKSPNTPARVPQGTYGMRQRLNVTVVPAALLESTTDQETEGDDNDERTVTDHNEPAVSQSPVTRRKHMRKTMPGQPNVPLVRPREIKEAEYDEYDHFAETVAKQRVMIEVKAARKRTAQAAGLDGPVNPPTKQQQTTGDQVPNAEARALSPPVTVDDLPQERVSEIKAEILARKKAGVYVNPPGARKIKAESFVSRGRPRNALIAVFRTNGLRRFEWFKANNIPRFAPLSGRKRTARVGRMVEISNEFINSDSETETETPLPRRRRIEGPEETANTGLGQSSTFAQDPAVTSETANGQLELPQDESTNGESEDIPASESTDVTIPSTAAVKGISSFVPSAPEIAAPVPQSGPPAPESTQLMSKPLQPMAKSPIPARPLPPATPKRIQDGSVILGSDGTSSALPSQARTSSRGPRLSSTRAKPINTAPAIDANTEIKRLRSKPGRKSKADQERLVELERELITGETTLSATQALNQPPHKPSASSRQLQDSPGLPSKTTITPVNAEAVILSTEAMPTRDVLPVPSPDALKDLQALRSKPGRKSKDTLARIAQLQQQLRAKKPALSAELEPTQQPEQAQVPVQTEQPQAGHRSVELLPKAPARVAQFTEGNDQGSANYSLSPATAVPESPNGKEQVSPARALRRRKVPATPQPNPTEKATPAPEIDNEERFDSTYVDAHPDEDFYHCGRGRWGRGVPPPGYKAKTALRGPSARTKAQDQDNAKQAPDSAPSSARKMSHDEPESPSRVVTLRDPDRASSEQALLVKLPLSPDSFHIVGATRPSLISDVDIPSKDDRPAIPSPATPSSSVKLPALMIVRPYANLVPQPTVGAPPRPTENGFENFALGRPTPVSAPALPEPHVQSGRTQIATTEEQPQLSSQANGHAQTQPETYADAMDIDIQDTNLVMEICREASTSVMEIQPSNNERLPQDNSIQPVEEVDAPIRPMKFGTSNGRSDTQQRQKLMLDAVQACGGVFPGDREMWFVCATVWQRTYGQTPHKATIESTIKRLISDGKLRRFKFQFRPKKRQVVDKHILANRDIEGHSPLISKMRERMQQAYPRLYLPQEVDISDELRLKYNKEEASSTPTTHVSTIAEPQTGIPADQSANTMTGKRKRVLSVSDPAYHSDDDEDDCISPGQAAMQGELQIQQYRHDFSAAMQPRPSKQAKFSKILSFDKELQKPIPKSTIPPQASRKPLGSLRSTTKKLRLRELNGRASLHGLIDPLLMSPAQAFHGATGTFSTNALATTRDVAHKSLSRSIPALDAAAWDNMSSQDWTDIVQRANGLASTHDQEPEEDFHTAAYDTASNAEQNTLSAVVTLIVPGNRLAEVLAEPSRPSVDIFNHINLESDLTPSPTPEPVVKPKRKYTTRVKRKAPDEDYGQDSDPEFMPGPPSPVEDVLLSPGKARVARAPKDMISRDRHSAGAFQDIDRLVVAMALVSAVCGGINQDRLNWTIIAHALSFRYDADFLRRRWTHFRRYRKSDVEKLRDAIYEPFLAAYEKNELPPVEFKDLHRTDWPALFEWVQAKVPVLKARQVPQTPDLPASREQLDRDCRIDQRSQLFELNKHDYFTSVTDMNRRHLALRYTHGTVLPGTMKPSILLQDDLLLLRSWVRAIAMTRQRNYKPEVAARKIGVFGQDQLQKVATEMVENRTFLQDRKGRHLPGRNFHLHNEVLQQFKRWPMIQGDERAHLQALAQSWHYVNEHFKRNESLQCSPVASDPEYAVLANMCRQGFLTVRTILPEKANAINAPFPKLSVWGYSGYSYETKKVDQKVLKFPMVYTKNAAYKYTHGLDASVPIPTRPATIPGEKGPRIPFWVDIHGSLLDDVWDMILRSILHLIVFRPGSKSTFIESSHNHKLWAWEIDIMLGWMEKVGIAVRCGDGKEIDGVWNGGWRAGEWWYVTFLPQIVGWKVSENRKEIELP